MKLYSQLLALVIAAALLPACAVEEDGLLSDPQDVTAKHSEATQKKCDVLQFWDAIRWGELRFGPLSFRRHRLVYDNDFEVRFISSQYSQITHRLKYHMLFENREGIFGCSTDKVINNPAHVACFNRYKVKLSERPEGEGRFMWHITVLLNERYRIDRQQCKH